MIKKILLITILFFTFIANSQAESMATGIIQNISIENNSIEINNIEYRVDSEQTTLISGMHTLDLELLEVGNRVNFLLKGNLIIEMQLTTPYEFNS